MNIITNIFSFLFFATAVTFGLLYFIGPNSHYSVLKSIKNDFEEAGRNITGDKDKSECISNELFKKLDNDPLKIATVLGHVCSLQIVSGENPSVYDKYISKNMLSETRENVKNPNKIYNYF